MAEQYLIDSNAVSDYLGGKLPESGMEFMNTFIDATPNLSVIAKIELLTFNASPEHTQLLQSFVDNSKMFELNSDVIGTTISVRKKHKLKVPDAIIAATAIVHDFSLITHNTSDFSNIKGLRLFDPYKV